MRCVVFCSVSVRAYVSGNPDILAAPPSGLVKGFLDVEGLPDCFDRPFFETDLEDLVSFRR
jgi:hypothetical protein